MEMNGTTSAAPIRGCVALVLREIDQLRRLAHGANSRFRDNGLALTHQGDHAPVVIRIHLAIEQVDAGNLHRLDNGINFRLVAAL